MKYVSDLVVWLFLFVSWMAGVVLAKGWLTVVAILVPSYAWYLVLELVMRIFGWI